MIQSAILVVTSRSHNPSLLGRDALSFPNKCIRVYSDTVRSLLRGGHNPIVQLLKGSSRNLIAVLLVVAKTQKLLPARLGPWPPEPVVHRERLGPPLGHHSHRFFLVLEKGLISSVTLRVGMFFAPRYLLRPAP